MSLVDRVWSKITTAPRYDGTDYNDGAQIQAKIDTTKGDLGDNAVPTANGGFQ